MPNHLTNETSPYLKQHQNNPVDWYPWNETALGRAKQEQIPIFLSIGYAACHWCHVMAHESFENPITAQLLNDHFISIKVDREERPDLDDIYMQAVVMLTGQGGWPMSVFLTPDLKPFYGGTYFPPMPRHGFPSFNQVLRSIIDAWNAQPETITNNAKALTTAIQKEQSQYELVDRTIDLEAVVDHLHRSYDWDNGGWGSAPKFPQPMLIEFLIQQALSGNQQADAMVKHLLKSMAKGGMYDLVGGGFHRYSTDGAWLIPHFEKMLYDNAQLALTYLHGYALTGDVAFKHTATETLSFISQEMTSPQGVFYASMDADTAEGEGRFYAWQTSEIRELLNQDEFNHLEAVLDLSEQGNFESGLSVLRRRQPADKMTKDWRDTDDDPHIGFNALFQILGEARAQRIPPAKDHKIIVEWNAMAIRAFAEAGLFLQQEEYLAIAKAALDFILENLILSDGKLRRTWNEDKASQPGTLADYANLILALHAIYIIDFEPHYFQIMRSLFNTIQVDFASQAYLYYDSAAHVTDLVIRPRNLQDNATPSGNALAAQARWLFANYENDPDHFDYIEQMISRVGSNLQRYPFGFGYWLQIAGLLAQETKQIVLVSQNGYQSLLPFLNIYRNSYRPHSIITAKHADFHPQAVLPVLIENRSTIDSKPTAYVCYGFTCQMPVTTPAAFEKQLGQE